MTIRRRIDRLDNAFLYEQTIDIETYDRHKERLQEELTRGILGFAEGNRSNRSCLQLVRADRTLESKVGGPDLGRFEPNRPMAQTDRSTLGTGKTRLARPNHIYLGLVTQPR